MEKKRSLEEELMKKVEMVLMGKKRARCLDDKKDLQSTLLLLSHFKNGLGLMAMIVQNFISSKGNDIINQHRANLDSGEKDKNDDPKFVKALIDLHEKSLDAIKMNFSGHSIFHKALKDAFVEVLNKNVGNHSIAELMSTHCDRVLKGGEKLSESEVEQNLDSIGELFSYLTEKDVFAEIYHNQMTKRLLNQRSASYEAEKFMITKLKMQCGPSFTSKMEGMLNDVVMGTEQCNEFDSCMHQHDSELNFSV